MTTRIAVNGLGRVGRAVLGQAALSEDLDRVVDPCATRGPSRAPGRVVVGVSGSETSAEALDWALDVAAQRGWTVDVVTAWPDLGDPFIHEVPGHYCDPRGRAEARLRAVMARSGSRAYGPTVRVCVDNADPVRALTARSRGADLLVVGASGTGQSRRRGMPAVGETCRRAVDCPTVVVAVTRDGREAVVRHPARSPGAATKARGGRSAVEDANL